MIGRVARVAATLAGAATLAIVVLVSWDVLMRYFFNRPQLFVDELASFLEILVIFGGAAYTFRAGGHVRVDLVTTHLPGRARAWLRAAVLAAGLAFLVTVIWTTTQSALTAYRYGRVSAVMLYPLWLPMLVIPGGLALMAIAMAGTLARQLHVLRQAAPHEVPPEEAAG